MNLDVLSSALLIGFLGVGHCIGMCGGIAGALTFAIDKDATLKRSLILLAYNVGRIFSYALIGALVSGIASVVEGLGFPYFRVIAAVLMILMGFYLSGIWKILTVLEKGGAYIWKYIQPFGKTLLPVKTIPKAILLGALWGWLPCGLVYTALAFSATQANPINGALVMTAFGLGTLPAVLLGGFAADMVKTLVQGRLFRYISAAMLVLFGLWTLYGSFGHAGHGNHAGHHEHHTEAHSGLEQEIDPHSKQSSEQKDQHHMHHQHH